MEDKKVLGEEGFNKWAKTYEDTVEDSREDERYPFISYDEIVKEVLNQAGKVKGKKLLDLGFGTGKILEEFYKKDYKITGLDFSKEMVKIAGEKMPNANLLTYDFSKGLSKEILEDKFDIVIITYAIHHLDYKEQENLIKELIKILNDSGSIIIADVMTNTREEMKLASEKDKDIWDFDEYYIVVEDLSKKFLGLKMDFIKKSYCSGVLVVKK